MRNSKGMRVVVSTYRENGTLNTKQSFYVDDDTDIINNTDNVENFLFESYDKFLEGGEDDLSTN